LAQRPNSQLGKAKTKFSAGQHIRLIHYRAHTWRAPDFLGPGAAAPPDPPRAGPGYDEAQSVGERATRESEISLFSMWDDTARYRLPRSEI
jgi:hypothetical protein